MEKRDDRVIFMCSSVHVWSDTRIYFKEAKSLAVSGYKVEFFAQDHDGEKEEIANITMNYLPFLSRSKRKKHRKVLWQAFLKSKAKFFHFHDPELLFLAKKIKQHYGDEVKITYDMHEHLPAAILTKQWISKPLRKIISKLALISEKRLMKYVDAVVFAELSYRRNYSEITAAKVDVLNYPVLPSLQIVEKEPVFTMVYVGLLTEQRGLFNMLELAAELKAQGVADFHLKLIGPIFTNQQKITAFIAENNLNDQVIWHDRMQYKDIWEHYYKAHVGLCLLHPTPNNLNSHSTKLFEYMAAKLPILASDFPDFVEMLKEEDCGFTCQPFDYKRLAEAIIYLKTNPKKAVEMGNNGKQAFLKFYSWENEANKLVALYDSLRTK